MRYKLTIEHHRSANTVRLYLVAVFPDGSEYSCAITADNRIVPNRLVSIENPPKFIDFGEPVEVEEVSI